MEQFEPDLMKISSINKHHKTHRVIISMREKDWLCIINLNTEIASFLDISAVIYIVINLLQKLTRGNDNWSVAEVMHALILLAHFHALSSFVYSCGINPEIDHEGGHTFRSPSSSDTIVNDAEAINGNLQDSGPVSKTTAYLLPL